MFGCLRFGAEILPLLIAICAAALNKSSIFHPASASNREDTLFSEQHLPRPARGVAMLAVCQPADNIGIFIGLEWALCHELRCTVPCEVLVMLWLCRNACIVFYTVVGFSSYALALVCGLCRT